MELKLSCKTLDLVTIFLRGLPSHPQAKSRASMVLVETKKG